MYRTWPIGRYFRPVKVFPIEIIFFQIPSTLLDSSRKSNCKNSFLDLSSNFIPQRFFINSSILIPLLQISDDPQSSFLLISFSDTEPLQNPRSFFVLKSLFLRRLFFAPEIRTRLPRECFK